jgi:C-terminal region of Mon2 protein
VFGVYDLVVAKVNDSGDGKVDLEGNAVGKSRSRYKVNVHHSRDSAGKQWIATQVLTLQGLSRVLRSFFSQILDLLDDGVSASLKATSRVKEEEDDDEDDEDSGTSDDGEATSDEDDEAEEFTGTEEEVTEATEESEGGGADDPWLVRAWSKILECALQAAAQEGGRETVDLRYAGVDLLVLCGQLSCRAGINAAITPAKVGTNMQVINGALREVDESDAPKDAEQPTNPRTLSRVVNDCREALFLNSMERMHSYGEFFEASEESKGGLTAVMEETQVQVLQKYVSCLGSLYECCKDDELSQKGELGDKKSLSNYFVEPSATAGASHLECRFVRMLITIAKAASGGPRFLSPAQRSSIDLLRTMIRNGSSEAFLSGVDLAGSWLFL